MWAGWMTRIRCNLRLFRNWETPNRFDRLAPNRALKNSARGNRKVSFRKSGKLFIFHREEVFFSNSIGFKYILPSESLDIWLASLLSKPKSSWIFGFHGKTSSYFNAWSVILMGCQLEQGKFKQNIMANASDMENYDIPEMTKKKAKNVIFLFIKYVFRVRCTCTFRFTAETNIMRNDGAAERWNKWICMAIGQTRALCAHAHANERTTNRIINYCEDAICTNAVVRFSPFSYQFSHSFIRRFTWYYSQSASAYLMLT